MIKLILCVHYAPHILNLLFIYFFNVILLLKSDVVLLIFLIKYFISNLLMISGPCVIEDGQLNAEWLSNQPLSTLSTQYGFLETNAGSRIKQLIGKLQSIMSYML